MIKIIIFQDKNKGFRQHATKRTIKDINEDKEYERAINELKRIRGEQNYGIT